MPLLPALRELGLRPKPRPGLGCASLPGRRLSTLSPPLAPEGCLQQPLQAAQLCDLGLPWPGTALLEQRSLTAIPVRVLAVGYSCGHPAAGGTGVHQVQKTLQPSHNLQEASTPGMKEHWPADEGPPDADIADSLWHACIARPWDTLSEIDCRHTTPSIIEKMDSPCLLMPGCAPSGWRCAPQVPAGCRSAAGRCGGVPEPPAGGQLLSPSPESPRHLPCSEGGCLSICFIKNKRNLFKPLPRIFQESASHCPGTSRVVICGQALATKSLQDLKSTGSRLMTGQPAKEPPKGHAQHPLCSAGDVGPRWAAQPCPYEVNTVPGCTGLVEISLPVHVSTLSRMAGRIGSQLT